MTSRKKNSQKTERVVDIIKAGSRSLPSLSTYEERVELSCWSENGLKTFHTERGTEEEEEVVEVVV